MLNTRRIQILWNQRVLSLHQVDELPRGNNTLSSERNALDQYLSK